MLHFSKGLVLTNTHVLTLFILALYISAGIEPREKEMFTTPVPILFVVVLVFGIQAFLPSYFLQTFG